ncbi:TPA: hypothetical protein N0F65_003699 [Lagenidium giganteum]|uniref:Nudix hydrolase domain-containing protein n=1 Tax=Lagenidium giganteum TaxID=4803 RepID=A0AAV2YTC6_9STRA|nr:TPA: hypothetical protein N0F65_003699 [Lagenidium giganteum]
MADTNVNAVVANASERPTLGHSGSSSKLLESRTGRDKQRYDGDRRLLACAVILRRKQSDTTLTNTQAARSPSESEASSNQFKKDEWEVLLISSSKHPDEWIIPKGGWESDESSEEGAIREADEEGGVAGKVVRDLGSLDFYSKKNKPCRIYDFLLKLDQQFDWWAEQTRRRQWVEFKGAADLLRPRPELAEMLTRAFAPHTE